MKRSFSLLDRAGAFVRTKGFYLVLAGCLATAGAAALLALSPAPEAENAPAGQSQDERLTFKVMFGNVIEYELSLAF